MHPLEQLRLLLKDPRLTDTIRQLFMEEMLCSDQYFTCEHVLNSFVMDMLRSSFIYRSKFGFLHGDDVEWALAHLLRTVPASSIINNCEPPSAPTGNGSSTRNDQEQRLMTRES